MTTSPNGRLNFSKNPSTIPLPNLIQVQRTSYEDFLQMDSLPVERRESGLQSVLSTIFPFTDFRETCELQFVRYEIGNWSCRCGNLSGLEHLRLDCGHCNEHFKAGDPHESEVVCPSCGKANRNRIAVCGVCGTSVSLRLPFTAEECRERGMTYQVPLRQTFRLVTFDTEEDGTRQVRDVKEEELYFGELPLMTDTGTFIINGTERVIVSQLHRSPGVFFTLEGPNHYLAKVVPYRGSWIEFEYDSKQILWVRIDRKRRLPGTVFLRALSPELETNAQILRAFYTVIDTKLTAKKANLSLDNRILDIEIDRQKALRFRKVAMPTLFAGLKLDDAMRSKLEKASVDKPVKVSVGRDDLIGAIVVDDLVDPETGEVIAPANARVTEELLAQADEAGLDKLALAFPDWDPTGEILHQTLEKDSSATQMDARMEIYRRQRPGDPPTEESATTLFNGLFFDERKYDLSPVGRFKFNAKLGLGKELEQRILDVEDFLHLVRYLLCLHRDLGRVDDIDSLANRRVRTVGELMENQFRIGLVRMERAIKEKMSIHPDIDSAMPRDLVNSKPVMAAVDEFFGSSQLSQFMDQTNPLSEVTHKRRLSALGPGGLSRERAGFEVRDVHSTHYGRICPIETPEGPNIGLISSLSCYARLNSMGYIESPYKKVEGGRVREHVEITQVGESGFKLGEVVLLEDFNKTNARLEKAGKKAAWGEPHAFYLPAWEEENLNIAQANAKVDDKGNLVNDKVIARSGGEFLVIDRDQVDFIDVSPRQVVSVAASLIPFLEHDDANRALMGSNMQRQAVPLVRPEAPIVGTGMESVVAQDSGAVVVCHRNGVVDKVDSQRIIVRVEGSGEGEGEFGADIYQMTKFRRSNQNTSINQKPLVAEGQTVIKGQVLADGPNTQSGELALGHNVLVAFMPWRGYNFEDAIVVSERLVKDDKYTSIHIEEFETSARDTKLGPEEITRDIPNVSESALGQLDEAGIIHIGAQVRQGSILVGKVTPKGETQLTPEEKLLRAIFGEKAGDVRDASLRCPPGIEGVVVGVQIFARKGVEKDSRQLAIENDEIDRIRINSEDEKRIILEVRDSKISKLLLGVAVTDDIKARGGDVLVAKGGMIDAEALRRLTRKDLLNLPLKNSTLLDKVRLIIRQAESQIEVLDKINQQRIERLREGHDLQPGVIKQVKVFIAMKRKLQVGDKMAGRHGNKGVISQVLPEEDLPFLPDGTPVEIILNPLGVPSRMNVGQILETHLGWAGYELGLTFATPVFEGATEDEIREMLERSGLPEDGKSLLYDGRTGQSFEQRVTVGYIYMLKLSHLVDDKIHARSIGPYSLITQQPLGGKAQFGGQRLGEMEVWALEAFGAAHTLQELLTVKSDDVEGRAKVYEAIVKGQVPEEPGLPESFNVLVRELQALALDVELLQQDDE
ncbi:MAG TPA: DNA-directed RNA polymerase subunit beta [Candidatus Sulfomarinibacteraceae bacterium]|nr:DNA-directed RNA polymerase subunit beta [Candidatus Sulfomarinibacteraceae bacterium]